MGPHVCALLAVGVVVCLIHLAPVRSQCTTKHCFEDDTDVSALEAMLYRLQYALERQQDTIERQQTTLERQQTTLERQQTTLERQQATLEHQHSQITELNETLAKQQTLSVDGDWSPWTDWSTCSVTCGGGRRQRTRSCDNPAPKAGGADCSGKHAESRACNNPCSEQINDCKDVLNDGNNASDVYVIYLVKAKKFIRVFCDLETDGGGWLVFQKRKDGSVSFYRGWGNYKEGFGDLTGEFWLGNDYLQEITSQAKYTLRVDLEAFNGSTRYAVYTTFAVASESAKYRLSVGGYRGTAGDSMHWNDGMVFSTEDRQNIDGGIDCAAKHKAGWWFGSCGPATLNGVYRHDGSRRSSSYDGINWYPWLGGSYSLKSTEMKIKS